MFGRRAGRASPKWSRAPDRHRESPPGWAKGQAAVRPSLIIIVIVVVIVVIGVEQAGEGRLLADDGYDDPCRLVDHALGAEGFDSAFDPARQDADAAAEPLDPLLRVPPEVDEDEFIGRRRGGFARRNGHFPSTPL